MAMNSANWGTSVLNAASGLAALHADAHATTNVVTIANCNAGPCGGTGTIALRNTVPVSPAA